MVKKQQNGGDCTCEGGRCKCGRGKCKCGKTRRVLAGIARVICSIVFLAAAVLVLLNIFGVVSLSIDIGIFVAITVLAIIAIYSAFHLFWGGLFFLAATIVVIMNANGIVFSLDGVAIGNLYIAAALLTVAFHLIFRHSSFGIHIGDHSDTSFGSSVRHFEGELDYAGLECNFGSVKAYLEKAELKDGKAQLDLECNFGSIELFVPKNWKVIDDIGASFGATVEKNYATLTEKSPVLTLTGEVNFGGITIVYS